MLLSRLIYYSNSAFTLLRGFRDPPQILGIFLNRVSNPPTEIQLRQSGWRFMVRTAMDVWVIKETCLDEDYLWAVGELKPDWRVVDIGAGLGDFTVFASKHCPKGIIHAYEPLAESFTLLTQNLQLNKTGNVKVYDYAIASEADSLVREEIEREAVSSRFIASELGENAVAAIDLEHVLDKLPEGICDFMKIDCEGCEYDLLLNSTPEILRRIKRISLEYHLGVTANTEFDLAAHLTSFGFSVRTKKNPVHSYLGFLYAEQE